MLRQWFPHVPQLIAQRVVIVVRITGSKGTGQRFRETLAPGEASSCIGVGGGARGFGHVAAAAVLLHDQPLWDEMEGRCVGQGEGETVFLHGEPKGAALVLSTLHRVSLALVLIRHELLWKPCLLVPAQRLIVQSSIQFESHDRVDVMGLHTPGVELRASVSVSAAVLSAATWEVEAIHLCV